MYVKVVQFTSTSKIQKEMLGAYLQTVWFPELIKLGALSCRYVSLDDTKSMIINMFPDEAIGESVQVGREEQRKELREQHKFTVFKGYSEHYIEKWHRLDDTELSFNIAEGEFNATWYEN